MTNNNIYFIANWKMNGNLSLIKSLKKVINLSNNRQFKNIKIIYCPPFTLIDRLSQKTKNSNISVGAQDCDFYDNYGPYTGSVSTKILKDIGAQYIILGHSEMRDKGDTNNTINKKILLSLKQKLKVILCIGENKLERREKRTHAVLKNQLINCLKNIKTLKNIVIAYEPIWSIGTGLTPTKKNLYYDLVKIINLLKKKFKNQRINIIYGGSINNKNIKNFKFIKNLNGFLIGGASLNEKKFIDIIKKTIN